jgi:hypothetical protein
MSNGWNVSRVVRKPTRTGLTRLLGRITEDRDMSIKYRCSRATFKSERDALAHLASTKRGQGKNFAKMKKRHSNFEWVFVEVPSGD